MKDVAVAVAFGTGSLMICCFVSHMSISILFLHVSMWTTTVRIYLWFMT